MQKTPRMRSNGVIYDAGPRKAGPFGVSVYRRERTPPVLGHRGRPTRNAKALSYTTDVTEEYRILNLYFTDGHVMVDLMTVQQFTPAEIEKAAKELLGEGFAAKQLAALAIELIS